MGLDELRIAWDEGAPWNYGPGSRDDRAEHRAKFREIVGRFMSQSVSVSAFKTELDSFAKQTDYVGFKGPSGQMFFNTLVNAADEEDLSGALRDALVAPADEEGCRASFAGFLQAVERAGTKAAQQGATRPVAAFAPFFLSCFWEADEPELWPIYYKASREVLKREGLFIEQGDLVDRYLNFRRVILDLRDEFTTNNWEIEAFLYRREKAETPQVAAWLFQANPAIYDIDRALAELQQIEWTVLQNTKQVHKGDRVYIWRSGPTTGGVVAVGRVESEPAESPPDPSEEPYFQQPEALAGVVPRVKVIVERVLDAPLLRPVVLQDPVLKTLAVLKFANQTVYSVTPEQDARLRELMGGGAPVAPLPTELQELDRELRRKRQVILQGPPGVGKTFLARRYISWLAQGSIDSARLTSLLGAVDEDERTVAAVADSVEAAGVPLVWDIVQFHPSYTYEDFIRGLVARPLAQGVTFEAKNKIGGWMAAVAEALKARGSSVEAVLVIDEINRGDISKIFGELIYGLEYRDQAVSSPYFVEGRGEIVIPSNLLLIGTMNTADRSIALVDYALRRRFVFLDVRPDRDVIKSSVNFSGELDRDAALWLFDQVAGLFSGGGDLYDLQVGHSYFLLDPPKPDSGAAGCDLLAARFGYEIYPLLLEYEAEGRFESHALDTLLTGLGMPVTGHARQKDVAQVVAERLKAAPWKT